MIFVTGGSGLLGHHLIKSLAAQGKPVRAIYRSSVPSALVHDAEWVQGDILDIVLLEEVLHGVSQVYHCAATVSFNPRQKAVLHQVNVDGTANLVNACLDAGIQKLLHVSSVAALGKKHGEQLINEKMQWTPETGNSEYGKTKYLGEMEVWRGVGEGLNAVIINPSFIFGEWGTWGGGSMAMFKNVKQGFPWYSTGVGGFTDASDVATAMIRLMESSISGERFIVSAENRSFKDVFFMIADAFGVKRPSKQVTPFLAEAVWRLEKWKSAFSGKEPFITKETASNAMETVRFDNRKLLATLPGFEYTPLQKTLERICKVLANKY